MSGLLPAFAVRVRHADGRWEVDLLATDAGDELPVLERALGAPGSWVVVVDSRLYFVVLARGAGGGPVRALISDATSQEWLLAAEVVERYGLAVDGGIPATVEDALDGNGPGRPDGDLGIFADAGMPAEEMARLLAADDLWAEEMVARIAERLGFAEELEAVVGA